MSLSTATSLTHCTLSRPLVVIFFFLPARRNQQQWGHKVKRQALITLWYNAPSQVDSAQCRSAHSERSTAATLRGEDAGDRGAIRGGRGVGGRHGGGSRCATPATSYPLPPPLPSLSFSSRSRTIIPPAVPATPSTYRLPCRCTRTPSPAVNLRPPFPRAFSLTLSIAAATTGCGIDWPSCPSSERGGRSNIRTRPTTVFFTFIAIFTCRLLLHLCVHLFFGAR